MLGQGLDEVAHDSIGVPGPYLLEPPPPFRGQGHIREMQLVKIVMTDMTKWDKPWSPTQGCLQCGNCGKLSCWTHSDNRKPCECGVTHWIERVYLQKELDNG